MFTLSLSHACAHRNTQKGLFSLKRSLFQLNFFHSIPEGGFTPSFS